MFGKIKQLARGLIRLHRRFMAGKKVRKFAQGVWFELDLSENIDSSLYYYGYYEKDTTQLLTRLIAPDAVVLDVGANVGAHCLPMAELMKNGPGTVHAFEPTRWAFGKLERNVSLNRLPNLKTYRMALSDRNGEEDIVCAATAETLPFKASWDISGQTKNTAADRIVFRRLDDWAQENGLARLDLFKVDVDGYEVRVLRGAKETLRRFRPVIVIELGTTVERVGDSLAEAISILQDELGYDLRSPAEGEAVFSAQEALERIRRDRTVDFLCRPRA